MMKIAIQILLFTLLIVSCKKDDDGNRQTNTAPEAFALLTVENETEDAALNPTFTWQPATDIDGDSVVYDLYLEIQNSNGITVLILDGNQTSPDPTIIIAQGLTETSFTITDPLPRNSQFIWKVVARDNQGGTVESEIFRFFTRPLNSGGEAHTAAAAFDFREGHGSVFFKEKFWVIGGFANIEGYKSDVWSSADGKNWVQETADAGFNGRLLFGITIFKDKIFIIGGIGSGSSVLGDVWSSADGIDWVQETPSADFSPRSQIELVAYRGKLYALGGVENLSDPTNGSTDEIWSSTNGVDWVQETDSAPYSSRFGFEAIVFDDKIFMIGGALSTTFETQADVWYSTNGKNWTQTQQPVISFSARVHFKSTVFNGKIWLTGGFLQNALKEINYTDFWSSSDGIRWKRETADAGYEARSSSTLVSNQEYMLLIGGRDATTTDRLNDVWKFD